ncbi:MAG: glycosyltransferase [candidate division KSB1 bacterium]|nr:glycosyltransferase [candidate division KSB1 bacterium]MDZ7309990.1 glycosyltransferase [candidate division KSB1 bacterium]
MSSRKSLPQQPESSRRVLFISYYFPPLGMGGTQRVAKWCKYLRRLGWQISVITVKHVAYYAFDDSLLQELEDIRIIRTGSLDPTRLLYLFRRKKARRGTGKEGQTNWLFWFLLPDSRVLWVPFAILRAWREIRRQKIPLVVTSGPPHSCHFVGWILAKLTGIKWVSDFRDSWWQAGLLPIPIPTICHRFIHRKMEKRIATDSHAVLASSQGLAAALAETGQRASGATHFIPNGYDAEDFAEPPPPANSCFDLAHVGTITGIADPRTLLEGFRLFVETAQLSPAETKLHFIGADVTGNLAVWMHENQLAEYVTASGYLSHREAVRALRHADLLVYLVRPGIFTTYIPGKTFEYLAAGKPILAIGDRIEGMQLLLEHAPVRHCAFEAVDAIRCALLAFYQEFRSNTLPKAAPPPQEFSREWQARKLAEILSALC